MKNCNDGYNYFNRIFIRTTDDYEKNIEFFVKIYGLNEKIIKVAKEKHLTLHYLKSWVNNQNNLILNPDERNSFLFNNLIPVNSVEEAKEKWGCTNDIDTCCKRNNSIDNITQIVPYGFIERPSSLSFNFNMFEMSIDKYFHYCCGSNVKCIDEIKDIIQTNITTKVFDDEKLKSKDNIYKFVMLYLTDWYSKKPIGQKFCETLSKMYPDYTIGYLCDNALEEDVLYVEYNNGEITYSVKPQGEYGDDYNGPNSPYIKAVALLDSEDYVKCLECGKILCMADNYKYNNKCPNCNKTETKTYGSNLFTKIDGSPAYPYFFTNRYNDDYDEDDE